MTNYKEEQWKHVSLHELTNMPDVPPGIIPLHEMAKYIDKLNCNRLPFTKQINHRYLIYHELRFIDSWLDDRGLDSILATPRYRQATRKVTLTQLFRAELLKAWRYGEISYRKYCDLMINKLENKTVRSFLHLPLHKKTCIHHSQLSGFRTKMTITQRLNLMVYVTHLLLKEVKIPQPYPLLSLVAPANHHDNLFLPQLVAFAQAIGLSIRVITADAAYGDAGRNQQIKPEHGVTVITPANKTVKMPEHVDPKRRQVFCDDYGEIPMHYLGNTESGHESGGDASPHECFRAPICPQGREIPFDSGRFGQMPDIFPEVNRIRLLRKHRERSSNLFKHHPGSEHLRLKSQPVVQAAATVAHLATVLAAIAAHHHLAGKEKRPKQLPLAA